MSILENTSSDQQKPTKSSVYYHRRKYSCLTNTIYLFIQIFNKRFIDYQNCRHFCKMFSPTNSVLYFLSVWSWAAFLLLLLCFIQFSVRRGPSSGAWHFSSVCLSAPVISTHNFPRCLTPPPSLSGLIYPWSRTPRSIARTLLMSGGAKLIYHVLRWRLPFITDRHSDASLADIRL